MEIGSFSEALTKVYIDNPCRIQPNALWKTLKVVDSFYKEYVMENDEVRTVKLWNDEMLYTFWDRDNSYIDIADKDINEFKTILVHESQMKEAIKNGFSYHKLFFRLIHSNKDISNINIPDNYYIRNVDINTELQLVSDTICCCYDDIKPNIDEVIKWTKYPVFHNDLWIWIIEKNTEKPVALGIAELDMNIKEGSFEWIQVIPDYQGNGLGKILVMELLNRLKSYVDFTTVSGEIDNITNPERLYRSCGFTGDDIWHVLRK